MALIHYAPCDVVSGGAFSCAPSLVARCLPSLTVLEGHGLTNLTLMVRVEDGLEVQTAILHPRFFDPVRVTKKHHDELASAVVAVNRTVSSAIETSLADEEDEDEMPSSFFACVSLQRRDHSPGWSIYCEIVATVADDHPNVGLKLR